MPCCKSINCKTVPAGLRLCLRKFWNVISVVNVSLGVHSMIAGVSGKMFALLWRNFLRFWSCWFTLQTQSFRKRTQKLEFPFQRALSPLKCVFNVPFQGSLRKGSLFLNFLRRFISLFLHHYPKVAKFCNKILGDFIMEFTVQRDSSSAKVNTHRVERLKSAEPMT